MQTKQEYSAGGVVYKQENTACVFLLGKHSGYHKWVLPKGMIEEGEQPAETAIRETEEEMGVKAAIVRQEPIHIETYWYMADFKEKQEGPEETRRVAVYQEQGGGKIKVHKTVTFYLMEYTGGNAEDHGWEMEDAGWFSYKEALEKMSFEGEKKALEIANKLLTTEMYAR